MRTCCLSDELSHSSVADRNIAIGLPVGASDQSLFELVRVMVDIHRLSLSLVLANGFSVGQRVRYAPDFRPVDSKGCLALDVSGIINASRVLVGGWAFSVTMIAGH